MACLWSHRKGNGGQPIPLSFAAIAGEPPSEIAAAGHDCSIAIKPENVDAWLDLVPARNCDLYAILGDRQRPYYEHRMAA